jgi:hypothetical protein
MDLDELLNEINKASSTQESKNKKKKEKKVEKVEVTQINTDQIVETFEAVKLGNPAKQEQNFNNALEGENVVKVLETGEICKGDGEPEEEKKKKRKKKKKKAGDKKEGDELEDEKEVSTDLEKNFNNFRHLFDFSALNVTDSRFQDNSMFRVLKNWEEKPWPQT